MNAHLRNAAVFASALVVLAPAAASAQFGSPVVVTADANVRTAVVSYSDLNLSSPQGLARLQSRVRGAVRLVCSPETGGPIEERIDAQLCRSNALASASDQIERAAARQLAGGGSPEVLTIAPR